jgi:tRNA (mo5U34)-methyltransferase
MSPTEAYESLYKTLEHSPAAPWLKTLSPQLEDAFSIARNANLPVWQNLLDDLPSVKYPSLAYENNMLNLADREILSPDESSRLESTLRLFHPWRKGPIKLANIQIDTEWRSDWKWDRLKDGLAALEGRRVLDIGSGNGYHCWRMLGDGADCVIGVDPTLLFVMQFLACKHFAGDAPVWVLPLGVKELPSDLAIFDTVFSMGVLYHRRSPIDHLFELQRLLRPGGELVLETLVVDGELGYSLVPHGRYAQMRNVWFIPSCPTLTGWMKRCGFVNVRVIDVTKTSTREQRSTDWMRFQSLANFLDPHETCKTTEGHPAPSRAIVVANRQD